jgi:hypothetical protein
VAITPATPNQYEEVEMLSFDEIVEVLDQRGQRATYGAVAAILGQSPRSLLKGRDRGRRFSWIVNRGTGLPTGYEEEQIDPRLRDSAPAIASEAELRTWLESQAAVSP